MTGVVQVWAFGDRRTVAGRDPHPWPAAPKPLAQAIRTALADPFPTVAPVAPATRSENLLARTRDLRQREVNTGLAQHGGQAELVDIVDGIARVRLSGGCQGCGAAKMTLTYGIEQKLRTHLPELRGVQDITDHTAGNQP